MDSRIFTKSINYKVYKGYLTGKCENSSYTRQLVKSFSKTHTTLILKGRHKCMENLMTTVKGILQVPDTLYHVKCFSGFVLIKVETL